jgi:carbon monoxide dehydrogenase subunit G
MRLEHSFEVGVPMERAWAVLLDVERIAPCMPGAALSEFDGDTFTGTVRVKLGPVSLSYKGKGEFVERDEAARRVVIKASGQDSRGAGAASATVTASLHPTEDNASTKVDVATDLQISGRAAQFGRGMIGDVSERLLGQFVDCLTKQLAAEPVGPAAAGAQSGGPQVASPHAADASPATPPSASPQAAGTHPATPPSASPHAADASPATPQSAGPRPVSPQSAGSQSASPPSAGPQSVSPQSATEPAPPAGAAAAPPLSTSVSAEPEPIDLLAISGVSGAVKRAAPYVLGVVVLGLAIWALVAWFG